MRDISESKERAAQWLTSVPKNSTPLEVATDAAKEVADIVDTLSNYGQLDDLLESLQTVLSAMYTLAGAKYPDDIDLVEAPTEEDMKRAFDNLSYVVDTENLFECLSHNMGRAMDVINRWYDECYPEDEDESSD